MSKQGFYACLFKFILLGFAMFTIFRFLFVFRFGNFSELAASPEVFFRLIYNGLRFDAQVMSYILMPITVLFVCTLFSKQRQVSYGFCLFVEWYFVVMYTISCLLLILDQQFYLNFKSHYNLVLFDFFKESPLVLARSIWEEHPVLLFLLAMVAVFMFLRYASTWILNRSKSKEAGTYFPILFIGLYLILFPVALRGSVTAFPLRVEDIYVSGNKEVNDCVPNAIFMLKKAFSEKGKQFEIENEQAVLQKEGFRSVAEAVGTYFQVSEAEASQRPLKDWLYKVAPEIKNGKKYNVVLIVTESWSNKLMDCSHKDADLLCGMRQHLKEDILFRHFQSTSNSTINSLEAIATQTPYRGLFTSKYRYFAFPTSIAEPFNSKGYNTEFISGIELSWRNLFEVFPKQKFKKTSGKYEILKEFPSATYNQTWGIYDHEMLRCVFEKLKRKSTEPNFFLCLTSTSHTPFEFPQSYPLPPITLNEKDRQQYVGEEELVKDYLKGYQYTNKALGDFMTWIKKSPLAKNTVVVITGDHNVRMILPYTEPSANVSRYSVPLYMYLPPSLRKQVHVDTTRMGSHSDIMPTIAPLVLGGAKYFALGQDLFDRNKPSDTYYSINDEQVLHGSGLSDVKAERIAKARRVLLKCYFKELLTEK